MDSVGVGDILGNVNLDDIIAAGEKCDTEKLSELSQKCSDSIQNDNLVCTKECQEFFEGVGDSCGELIKTFGLEGMLKVCEDGNFNFDAVSDIADNTPTSDSDSNDESNDTIDAGEQIAENIEAGSNAIARGITVGVAMTLALL